jgi:hypothetical protein
MTECLKDYHISLVDLSKGHDLDQVQFWYNVHVDPFTQLKKKVLEFVDMPFVCNPNCENIQIVQLYLW